MLGTMGRYIGPLEQFRGSMVERPRHGETKLGLGSM